MRNNRQTARCARGAAARRGHARAATAMGGGVGSASLSDVLAAGLGARIVSALTEAEAGAAAASCRALRDAAAACRRAASSGRGGGPRFRRVLLVSDSSTLRVHALDPERADAQAACVRAIEAREERADAWTTCMAVDSRSRLVWLSEYKRAGFVKMRVGGAPPSDTATVGAPSAPRTEPIRLAVVGSDGAGAGATARAGACGGSHAMGRGLLPEGVAFMGALVYCVSACDGVVRWNTAQMAGEWCEAARLPKDMVPWGMIAAHAEETVRRARERHAEGGGADARRGARGRACLLVACDEGTEGANDDGGYTRLDADRRTGVVLVLRRGPRSARLEPPRVLVPPGSLCRPSGLALSADGAELYVTSLGGGGEVRVFAGPCERQAGAPLRVLRGSPARGPFYSLAQPWDAVLSDDGAIVYVACHSGHEPGSRSGRVLALHAASGEVMRALNGVERRGRVRLEQPNALAIV